MLSQTRFLIKLLSLTTLLAAPLFFYLNNDTTAQPFVDVREQRFNKIIDESDIGSIVFLEDYFFYGTLYNAIGKSYYYLYQFDEDLEKENENCEANFNCTLFISQNSYKMLNQYREVIEAERKFISYFYDQLSSSSVRVSDNLKQQIKKNMSILINKYLVYSSELESANPFATEVAQEIKIISDGKLNQITDQLRQNLSSQSQQPLIYQEYYIKNKNLFKNKAREFANPTDNIEFEVNEDEDEDEANRLYDIQNNNLTKFTGHRFKDGDWALTYDDGPHKSRTDSIMNLLKANKMHATFFWLAKSIGTKAGLEVLGRAKRHGFAIANHSYSHADLNEKNIDLQREIIDSKRFMEEKLIDWNVNYFRLPFGSGLKNQRVKDTIARSNMYHFSWNVDSLDWKDPDPHSVFRRITKQMKIQKGGIILLHDIQKTSPKVTELLISHFKKSKDTVRPLSDILKDWGYKEAN